MHLISLSFTAECPVQEMDIVFLIDGSGSINQSGFSQMKAFVKTLMGQFASTNTSVSTRRGGLWKGGTEVASHSWWRRKSRGGAHGRAASQGQCPYAPRSLTLKELRIAHVWDPSTREIEAAGSRGFRFSWTIKHDPFQTKNNQPTKQTYMKQQRRVLRQFSCETSP